MIKTHFLLGGMAALMLTACVSTTSGPPKPKIDKAEAATQYYTLGARYYLNGQYELARERLIHALEFDPKMGNAHLVLAQTYQALDIPRLATEHFLLAIRYKPRSIDVRNTYAVFLCQQRDFAKAARQFESAIKIPENDHPEIMLANAGVCMMEKPDLAEAEKYFRRALSEKSNYAEALLRMALLKMQADDALSARAFLQRHISTDSPSAAILYLAVQVEDRIGNARASTDYTNQLLRDFPESAEAQRLLAANRS